MREKKGKEYKRLWKLAFRFLVSFLFWSFCAYTCWAIVGRPNDFRSRDRLYMYTNELYQHKCRCTTTWWQRELAASCRALKKNSDRETFRNRVLCGRRYYVEDPGENLPNWPSLLIVGWSFYWEKWFPLSSSGYIFLHRRKSSLILQNVSIFAAGN